MKASNQLYKRKLHSILELQDFSLPVHLGCEPWERSAPQAVSFKITFGFKNPTIAEINDELIDTICYAQVCKKLSQFTKDKHYKLIEKLANDCREMLIQNFPHHDYLKLRVHKLKPPVDLLTNGVRYTCGDMDL